MISRRGRNNGRPAFICGQSPQETCHCQRVERPSQSHKPHPNPLLAKEREEESVLSSRERVRERADLGGLEAKSCRLGFLPQQNSEGHGMIDLDLSSGLTHPLTSPPLKGGDMERLSISGLKDKFNFFSGTLPKRTYSPNGTSTPRKSRAAYTLTEIVIVMLIISVIVAVTIGVTKAKLDKITNFVKPLKDAGILVSLFIDPTEVQVKASAATGAQFIEMHTGQYSEKFGTPDEEAEFLKLKNSARLAQSFGLKVNAGHGLNYQNVHRMHEIPDLYELNIGHSIISRAVFVGLPKAVQEMKDLVK